MFRNLTEQIDNSVCVYCLKSDIPTSTTDIPTSTTPMTTSAPTTTMPRTVCQSCTLDATTVIMVHPSAKPFTSDTIDDTQTCAIRTLVCDARSPGGDVLVSFNRDDSGSTGGPNTFTTILNCNDDMQWTLSGIVITEIECQSA
uniref:Uncharacterized protein R07B1.7 n=2 Tax=Caenorhabditis elegans TaxID=6239 RepID=YRN7_CAEEL|nr:RecName: Full=Uncharacterized protein R07B1.7 [Caenorhabditis elegans]